MERTGECMYCGQTAAVFVHEEASVYDTNRQATLQCECEEAKTYKEIRLSMINAKADLERIFPGMKDLILILNSMIDCFEHGHFDKMTITQGQVKAMVSLTSDRKIQVDRVDVNVYSKKY